MSNLMPKVGDILFAKTYDVYSREAQTRPGIVTKVHTEDDGEYAKDREILSVVLFGGGSAPEEIDMDKGTTNDDGEREPGGWFTTYDDSGATVEPETVTTSPDTYTGPLGASANNPSALPGATSGASTSTVGDGSDTASVTQPT